MPRLASRFANFKASSTTQRTPSRPLRSMFSRAQVTTWRTESRCVTSAPAALAASEAAPVYANKFSTLGAPIPFALQMRPSRNVSW